MLVKQWRLTAELTLMTCCSRSWTSTSATLRKPALATRSSLRQRSADRWPSGRHRPPPVGDSPFSGKVRTPGNSLLTVVPNGHINTPRQCTSRGSRATEARLEESGTVSQKATGTLKEQDFRLLKNPA